MLMKKAIFLGVQKIHSNKKNQDYRKVEFYTPPFKDAKGFQRGGVSSEFTALDSNVGDGIPMGAIVRPGYVYDPYAQRNELTTLEVVSATPYNLSVDFND